MSEPELIEQLAAWEHQHWAAYVGYLIERNQQDDDSVVIDAEYATKLLRLTQASYAELSEDEKDLDREEVASLLPIIREYIQQRGQEEAER